MELPLLADGDEEYLQLSPGSVRDSAKVTVLEKESVEEQPPFSLRNEVRFFFTKGLPLGASAFLEWGVPPLFAMYFAGQSNDAADLQEALGYGRVFFNISILMPLFGFFAYFYAVIPGCLGAGRKDRIPIYFRRSMLLELLLMTPSFILQLFSGPIMELLLGASPQISQQVQIYTRLMLIPALLLLLETHVEIMHVNVGFARCATFNSLVTGLGVDVLCSWLFVYKLGLGVRGAAFTQIVVKAARLVVWALVMTKYGLWAELVWTDSQEQLLTRKEWKVFCRLGVPQVVSNFSGWFIFEMQLICMARISGITDAALAAGSVWVTLESTLAAVQDGWIKVCSMRTMVLLGRVDPNAYRSYLILCGLSACVVLLTNVPLLACSSVISHAMSSDLEVQKWLERIVWVLAMHSQIRISCIQGQFLLIPLGKPIVKIVSTAFSFYAVASPLAAVLALTDVATTDTGTKMTFTVAACSVGMMCNLVFGFWFMNRLDWIEMGRLVKDRANTDKNFSSLEGDDVAAGETRQYAPIVEDGDVLSKTLDPPESSCVLDVGGATGATVRNSRPRIDEERD